MRGSARGFFAIIGETTIGDANGPLVRTGPRTPRTIDVNGVDLAHAFRVNARAHADEMDPPADADAMTPYIFGQ